VDVTIVTIYNTIQVTSQRPNTESGKTTAFAMPIPLPGPLYTCLPLHIANAKSQSKRLVSFLVVFIISTHKQQTATSHPIRSSAARAHEDVTPTSATATLPLLLLLLLLLLGHRRIAHLRHVEVHRPD
jgi:uncharacterized protein (TIGR03382 family)